MATIEILTKQIIEKYGNNQAHLMDILIEVQSELRYIPDEAVSAISKALKLSKVDVEQTLSFYHFFSSKPVGKNTVYLNNSAVAGMMGRNEIAQVFEKEAGCKFGDITSDGLIGLFDTACIGMNDQEPAALINGAVFTKLTPPKVKFLVDGIKKGKPVSELVLEFGDGANTEMKTEVRNYIRKKGPVLFSDYSTGNALKKLVTLTPEQVILEVKNSNIRGRGGAGFTTGLKWDFCAKNKGEKYVICNADEGEPGTFKDRVILTELPHMIFEGMAIGGYAIGANKGILYLRSEYSYMKLYLENVLKNMRIQNMLGKNILGKQGFDFDIRIQFGAGAYVCGEESALIESMEGKRGEPRNRPPFPVEKGYLKQPTIVNNVETLSSVVRIIEKGADWYRSIGTEKSSGTKVLSISGDCKFPGIYEIAWGMSIQQMLEMCGAENVQAVQVAGPSGVCISPKMFDRKIAYEDLPTGGSMIVIGENRNLLKDVVVNFMKFFADESCGSCVPCRALIPVLIQKLEKIIEGKGARHDIDSILKLGKMMKALNRCGLGQTAANPVVTTIENFEQKYDDLVKKPRVSGIYEFDMKKAVQASCEAVNREVNVE